MSAYTSIRVQPDCATCRVAGLMLACALTVSLLRAPSAQLAFALVAPRVPSSGRERWGNGLGRRGCMLHPCGESAWKAVLGYPKRRPTPLAPGATAASRNRMLQLQTMPFICECKASATVAARILRL